jgi:CRISPR/Cas system-associated exonuclease Cas4 (RecB family)
MGVAIILLALAALALFVVSWVLGHIPRAVAEPMLADTGRRLRGRPDYLVRERGQFVPVELKPLRRSRSLYESDRMQIGVYMMLVKATYPRAFAGYGRVRYRGAEFVVPLTEDLEARCLALADRVREARRAILVHRTHALQAKCGACAHRAACGESLV